MGTKTRLERIQHRPYQKHLDQTMERVQRDLSERNYLLITKYSNQLIKSSIAISTRGNVLQNLYLVTKQLKMDWEDTTKDDIDQLIATIMSEDGGQDGKETNTSSNKKIILKGFYRWFKLGERDKSVCLRTFGVADPPETRGLVIKKIRSKITKDELITPDEMSQILNACNGNPRNRALIDVLAEAGSRAGELLTLQLKHVHHDKYGIVLNVDGKTGQRPIRLIRSVPTLTQWLNVHPLKDDPDSPLWIKTKKDVFGEPLEYAGAAQVVRYTVKRAGLKKNIWMHLFRHTAATETDGILSNAEQKIRYGWSQSSDMPSVYTHLNSDDVDKKLLTHYGVVKEDEGETEKTKRSPIKCQICETLNVHDAKFCTKCSKALSIKAAIEIENAQKIEKEKLLNEVKQMVAEMINQSHLTQQRKITADAVKQHMSEMMKTSIMQ